MAFSVFQAATTLYGLDQRGTPVALTLPTGVSLDTNKRLRGAVFGNYAVLVNSPNRPITVDANLNVRPLCPLPPSIKPTSAASSGAGGLTGKYRAKQTYRISDVFGRLIAESDYGPVSDEASLAAKLLALSALQLSNETISSHGLYRNTNAGDVYFKWLELDGNTQTSIEDDLADAGLSIFAAPSLGTPPDMYLLAEFRSRLFGVSKADIDNLRFSEIGAMYAWPSANSEPVPRIGSDNRGITGFARKRDALGVGRSNGFYQFTGTTSATFKFVNVSENCGVEAPDSVAVYRDIAYFLWKDGVYRWAIGGIQCISDEKIRRWFTSNDTFNLQRLQHAFAIIDPFTRRYKLFLASAGSTIEDCWIEYDIDQNKWWGPHTSHAFNPSAAFYHSTDSGLVIPVVGGTDGYVRRERKKRTDDTNTGIDFDLVTNRDASGSTDEKFHGELSVAGKPQAGGTLVVQTTAGDLNELRKVSPGEKNAQTIESEMDLTQSVETLDRVGEGQAFKIRFRNNQPGEDVNLCGYEVDNVFSLGRR